MDANDAREIKSKIEEEIRKTEKIIEDYRELTKPVAPENAIGRISRMDAINNKSITEAALRQAEEKLAKLKNMRSKVGTEDFGLCSRCKNPIPLARLIFMPQSNFCVNCAR